MKFLLLSLVTISTFASNKVIYGADDRKDYYQVSNAYKLLADATAGMVHNSQITKDLKDQTISTILSNSTLASSEQLCVGEKFSEQPLAPICSGFLVGEDTLVTAGHCYKSLGNMSAQDVCGQFSWVFDYHLNGENNVQKSVNTNSSIYRCKQVVTAVLDSNRDLDYAVIKLDRKVNGRTPLKFRTSGRVSDSSNLMVIGHPSGLPTKIADGGKLIGNDYSTYFEAALDTFHGNSGSAVIDSTTGVVEGILVAGKSDYYTTTNNSGMQCNVVNVCDMSGENCLVRDYADQVLQGERVTRISTILQYIK